MVGGIARAGSTAMLLLTVVVLVSSPPAAAQGFVALQAPTTGQTFEAGDTVPVFGRVVDFNGTPLGGVRVDVQLLNAAGSPVPGTDRSDVSAPNDGSFLVAIPIPEGAPSSRYTIVADAADVSVSDVQVSITVRAAFRAPGASALGALAVGTALAVAVVLALLKLTASRRKA